jgi:hypothetical protein
MLQNITHFGQADGTPFTIPPLNHITWAADDNSSDSLMQGNIPQNLMTGNSYADKVIQAIAEIKKLPEIDTYIPSKEVAKGFK